MNEESEKNVLVTADNALKSAQQPERDVTVLADADMRILEEAQRGNGIPITSAEEFMALARAAQETYDSFEKEIDAWMTDERAKEIRAWRVDEGYSWRAVAMAATEKWPDDATWRPYSNQLAGIALCHLAAKRFGEDHMLKPWN